MRVDSPQPGDLIMYPTIRLPTHPAPWIGHVAIVVGVSRELEFDSIWPDWSLLDVIQCCGPNGRTPAILATSGGHWSDHDRRWPRPEHRTVMLRVVP